MNIKETKTFVRSTLFIAILKQKVYRHVLFALVFYSSKNIKKTS
jgi:hypothetical protein